MTDALRYEIARLRSIRSTWWLTGLALAMAVLIAGLMSWGISHSISAGQGPDAEELRDLGPMLITQLAATGQVPYLVAYTLAMIGVFAWGHEYRHGMIRASLTALNSRSSFWLAKYVVVGVWVALVALVAMVLSMLVSLVFLSDLSDSVVNARSFATFGRATLYAVLLVWLAMAFTAITRSQAFALVFIFLWPLLIEPIVSVFFLVVPGLRDDSALTRFLPFNAGGQVLSTLRHGDSAFGDPLSALGGGLIFGGTAVVLMAASHVLFTRRDA